jgi:hypothetical protein
MTKLLKIYANEWNKTKKKIPQEVITSDHSPLVRKLLEKKNRLHPIKVGVWIASSRRSLIAFIVKIKEPVINEVT